MTGPAEQARRLSEALGQKIRNLERPACCVLSRPSELPKVDSLDRAACFQPLTFWVQGSPREYSGLTTHGDGWHAGVLIPETTRSWIASLQQCPGSPSFQVCVSVAQAKPPYRICLRIFGAIRSGIALRRRRARPTDEIPGPGRGARAGQVQFVVLQRTSRRKF